MNNSSIFRSIKKADLLLAAALLLLSFTGFVFLRPAASSDGVVVIRISGRIIAEYPLDTDITVRIPDDETGAGTAESGTAAADMPFNEIEILGREVCMRDANCSNRLCILQGKISRPGQSIICLPHRLTVEIRAEGTGKEVPDAVTH
ncbi:MAG: NusG domain II-containing protein [Lachnospiraceae bacterium]|nr:NusG domain II-containing protein [Lachnospiraceae bacterium]